MKALLFSGPEEKMTCRDVPLPQIEPDQLLVRIRCAGICGTDLHYYQSEDFRREKKLRYPFILGHEMAGEVVEAGRAVKRFSVGDRITTETHVPCGSCFYCLNDQQHVCLHLEPFAKRMGGVFAEYCRVPEYTARRLPARVSERLGSMFEPLGVAVRAVLEAGCQGDSLLVTGCGPIGVMAVGVAKVLGAGPVFAAEVVPERLQMASRMGADHALGGSGGEMEERILEATGGLGVGTFIEASGAPAAFNLGLNVLRRGGKAVIFGLGEKRAEVDVSRWIVAKEANITGIHGRRMFDTWRRMESLIEQKTIPFEIVMGEAFPLERYPEAFELALSGKTGKIFFEP
ncbi:MAG: alcohol dehydrogenase catalytic domain-containing protein [Deltaproteobacteria bacterium]|nr:alcohol dehydrogenase catalytic domain-containing protein [Deltaproteobacteria bacterium]